eukprot:scaffold31031_cov32-Attheya_sp.AAC.2
MQRRSRCQHCNATMHGEGKESIIVSPATTTIAAIPNQQVQQSDSQETRLEVLQPVASMHLISGQSVTPFTNEFILWDEIDSCLKIPTIPPAPAIATVIAPPPIATESDDQNTDTIVEETQRLDEQSNSGDTIVEDTQRLDEQSNSGDTIVEGTQRLDEQSNSGDTLPERI